MRLICILVFVSPMLFGQAWVEMSLFPRETTWIGHSWADFDGDGDPDLFLNGGTNRTLYINRLNEDGTFTAAEDLLPTLAGNGSAWAACWGDFDNDGDPDIHLGNQGADFLLENRYPEPFINVAEAMGLDDPKWCQSINWVDYNNDGKLDIYITHEEPDNDGPHHFYQNAWPDPFIPRFPQTPEETDLFGLADKNSHAYGLTWGDIDLDGDIDAVTSACGTADTIPNENPHNKVYRNLLKEGGDGFEDMSLNAGLVTPQEVAFGSESYWATLYDYNGDAFPDLFIGNASFGKDLGIHRLWRNTGTEPGDFGFELVPSEIHGVVDSWAFVDGACTGDVDNDGDLDIYNTPYGLYLNNGDGTYTGANTRVGSGNNDASFVDVDQDGDLDIYNFNGLWRNPGGYGNHWLAVELEGLPERGTTRDAFHVKIRVKAGGVNQYREHRYMVGSYSQHLLPTHFGLGAADVAEEVAVTWPDGTVDLYEQIPVDRLIVIEQGATCRQQALAETGRYIDNLDPHQLPALSSGGESVVTVRWQVISGPTTNLRQFNDPGLPQPTFTPLNPGLYRLALFADGCPLGPEYQVAFQDYDGDGAFNEGDRRIMAPGWLQSGGVFDRNQDDKVDVRDFL
ncbi:MAG: CRTAC1 family protein [Acidobacteriota bacterium]|nr:CRTAC1 family protein [Acidobacteriota bacterium]